MIHNVELGLCDLLFERNKKRKQLDIKIDQLKQLKHILLII